MLGFAARRHLAVEQAFKPLKRVCRWVAPRFTNPMYPFSPWEEGINKMPGKRCLWLSAKRDGDDIRAGKAGTGIQTIGASPCAEHGEEHEQRHSRYDSQATNSNARVRMKLSASSRKTDQPREQCEHGRGQAERNEQETAAIEHRCQKQPHSPAEQRQGGRRWPSMDWCWHGPTYTPARGVLPCVAARMSLSPPVPQHK